MNADCPKCEGIGIVENVGTWSNPAPYLATCQTCHGAGSIPAANPEQPQDNGHVLCPGCDGEGKP